jgi:VanZ family protein
MDKRFLFSALLAVYLVVFAVGMLSDSAGALVPSGYDKLLHALEFFVLAFLLFFTLRAFKVSGWPLFASIFILSSLLAFLSELAQLFTATRSFSWLDIAADLLGLTFALLLIGVFEWISSRR